MSKAMIVREETSSKRSSSIRRRGAALGLVWLAAAAASAQTPAPATSDILNGQRYMKETQDVSFVSVYQIANRGVYNADVLTYNTANSQFLSGTPSYQYTMAESDNLGIFSNTLPQQPPIQVASGRMFNTTEDEFVSISPYTSAFNPPYGYFWAFNYYNPPSTNGSRGPVSKTIYLQNSTVPRYSGTNSSWAVMGNFRGDGLVEALAVYENISGSTVSWGMTVLGASIPLSTDQLTTGPEMAVTGSLNQPQSFISVNQTSVAVGDFNGDGRDEIAVVMNDEQTIRFYSVDPNSYAISAMSPASIVLPAPIYRTSLIPGRFVLPNQVDLAVVGMNGDANWDLGISYINTQTNTGTFSPQVMKPATTPQVPTNVNGAYAIFGYASAVINPTNPMLPNTMPAVFGPQQLVLVSQNGSGNQNFWIGDFLVNKYAFTQKAYTNLGGDGCPLGMQPGNFDHQTSSGSYNPLEQVAVVYNKPGCTSGDPTLFIYSIDVPKQLDYNFSADSWLNVKSNVTVGPTGNQGSIGYPYSLALDVADVQGRSQRLGAPEIVRVPKQNQPDLILGMPPMAVDYVIPQNPTQVCEPNTGDGVTTPCVANISFNPTPANTTEQPFTTVFDLASTTSKTTSSTATTSWGLSIKTSAGLKVKFNDLESNASLDIKDTAQALYNSTVKQNNSSYSAMTNHLDIQTTTDDWVISTERDLLVYYYPVLGLTDENGNSIYVEFSQPTNLVPSVVGGAHLDWYQPVHEPGNIFSYPSSYTQLAQEFSNNVLPVTQTQGVQCALLGSADTSFSTQWITNSSTSQSLGSSSTVSNDLSISGSEGAGVSGVDSADISFGLDIGASTSLSSLNVDTSALASSTGVTSKIPAMYNFDGDSYYLANYIFSENAPSGTTVWQQLSPGTDLTTQGPLFVNYIADPLPQRPGGSCGAGSSQTQWTGMYPLPDVGFNHPQRWHWAPNGTTMGVSFNAANPANPVSSHFYHMKGFYITSPNSVGSGPNLTSAKLGDTLALTARVYNYSPVDTPQGGTIYVDFYGQAFCTQTANVCGNAFEIGEAKLTAQIPGFKSLDLTGPNWTTATVQFNTANFNLSPGPMVFWVITWMNDSSGNRALEMTGHGLTHRPAENLTSISQVALEPYSNNVGLYGAHTQFQIYAAPGSSAALSAASPDTAAVEQSAPTDGALTGSLSGLSVEPGTKQAHLDDEIDILGRFTAAANQVSSFSILYYDGDPRTGGTVFDHQMIHHIDANGLYVHRTSLQLTSCGTHKIYAEAYAGQNPPVISDGAIVNVTVDPIELIEGMTVYLQRIGLPKQYARPLLLNLQMAKGLFQQKEIQRGRASLQVFAGVVDAISGVSDSKTKAMLARLSGQARTINGCEQ